MTSEHSAKDLQGALDTANALQRKIDQASKSVIESYKKGDTSGAQQIAEKTRADVLQALGQGDAISLSVDQESFQTVKIKITGLFAQKLKRSLDPDEVRLLVSPLALTQSILQHTISGIHDELLALENSTEGDTDLDIDALTIE